MREPMSFIEAWVMRFIRATFKPKELVTYITAQKMDLLELTALSRAVRYRVFMQIRVGGFREEKEFLALADWDQAAKLLKLLKEITP